MDDFSAGGINLLPFAAIVSTEYNTHGNLYSTVTIKPFEPSYLEKPAIHRVNSIYRQPLFVRLLDAVNCFAGGRSLEQRKKSCRRKAVYLFF